MRFSDDTADIPDRLITLQERGEVVFLCGAGISQRYGLPSFYKLTTDIYDHLGESWVGHPAEEDAMCVEPDGTATGPAALDRALFALSKRLRGEDIKSRIRAERLLTEAIEAKLQPPDGPFVAHADVWTLSRDPEMRGRIVTTNFDTLFERALVAGTSSRSGADLPPPLGTDFAGILHLHGRIADEKLNLPRTSLVLNSAEFGEAYLRSGWAARYVYDLARATTIVILGYSADDPPMRYILEVLTADRARYPDIREIFAFVPSGADELARERNSAIWEAKGATAILYDCANSEDHDSLYRTISHWAQFAADPTGWRRSEAARILAQDPDAVDKGDWERLHWLLGGGDAGELLGEINPDPSWAAPLAKAEMFKSGSVPPFRWILKRLNDPKMPSVVAENILVFQEALAGIERVLTWKNRKSKDLHPVLLHAWRLIAQVAAQNWSMGPELWPRCITAIREGDFSLATKRDILACLQPRIRVGGVFRWPGFEAGPDEADLKLHDVLRVDWGPGPLDQIDQLVAKWPAETRGEIIRALVRRLEDALEEAAETGTLDTASFDVRSVSPHRQNNHADGFYSIVRTIIDLWDVESGPRPDDAKATAQLWLASPYILFNRMGLHALRQSIFSSCEIASALLRMPDEDFWLSDARRETMQLFVERWGSMNAEDQALVEERIISGLPRELLVPNGPEDQIAIVRDKAVFIRLARIDDAGHALSNAAQHVLNDLRAKYPEWQSQGERDDFRIWSSGVRVGGREGDISVLEGIEPSKLLERVEQEAAGDPMRQGDLWRLYCDAEPGQALAGLLANDPVSDQKRSAWQSFFWSITASEDREIQQAALAAVLRPEFAFVPSTAVSDWLLRKRDSLDVSTEDLLTLWDRLYAAVERCSEPVKDQSRRDPTFSMLNSAEGKIGTVLLNEYERAHEKDNRTDLDAILTRMAKLVGAKGELGFLGTAAIMDGLRFLYADAQDWATQYLLPLTQWVSPFAPAAWSVLLHDRIPESDLYAALKGSLLEAGRRVELDRSIDSVAGWLIAPLLWAQEPTGPMPQITAVEVRKALSQSMESVRSSAAHWLAGAIEELPGDRAATWHERIGPLFHQIWPLEPSCRSRNASVHLLRMALKTADAFADAAEAIAPALIPLETWEIESYLDHDEDAAPFYASAPGAVLTILDAVVSEDTVPPALLTMLERLAENAPALRDDHRYLKLLGWARRQASY